MRLGRTYCPPSVLNNNATSFAYALALQIPSLNIWRGESPGIEAGENPWNSKIAL
jgi:hypothetical protein